MVNLTNLVSFILQLCANRLKTQLRSAPKYPAMPYSTLYSAVMLPPSRVPSKDPWPLATTKGTVSVSLLLPLSIPAPVIRDFCSSTKHAPMCRRRRAQVRWFRISRVLFIKINWHSNVLLLDKIVPRVFKIKIHARSLFFQIN